MPRAWKKSFAACVCKFVGEGRVRLLLLLLLFLLLL